MYSSDTETFSEAPLSEAWSVHNQLGDPELYPSSPVSYLPNLADDCKEADESAEWIQGDQVRMPGDLALIEGAY